jgi:hypothetical protein
MCFENKNCISKDNMCLMKHIARAVSILNSLASGQMVYLRNNEIGAHSNERLLA